MDALLIVDPPARGSWNMAVDEMLFSTFAGNATTVLRLYQWSEPTLSLGYFQKARDRARHVASLNCPMVRRSTGGGAIVHDRELTYSLVIRLVDERPAHVRSIMARVHQSFVRLLRDWGVEARICGEAESTQTNKESFLCFQRYMIGDVLCGGYKVMGSAQRRYRKTLLQHGSILFERSPAAPELPGINDISIAGGSMVQFIQRWPELLADVLATRWVPSTLSEEEHELAGRIEQEKFAADAWNLKR